MRPVSPIIVTDEERLSQLARRFRGTRQDDERREIASEYAETAERLIQSGHWDAMPPPEDQLPAAWMPRVFSEFWATPEPKGGAVPNTARQRYKPQCRPDDGMNKNAKTIMLTDEELLSQLAGRFRSTHQDDARRKIADEYAEIVDRLIQHGRWDEAPPPEDQLPDDYMPRAFFDFWLNPPPKS